MIFEVSEELAVRCQQKNVEFHLWKQNKWNNQAEIQSRSMDLNFSYNLENVESELVICNKKTWIHRSLC